jgi:hypothetical protein
MKKIENNAIITNTPIITTINTTPPNILSPVSTPAIETFIFFCA